MYFVLLIILFISLIEACGQFCLKKESIEKTGYLNYIGIICYLLIAYLLLKVYKYKSLGYSNLVWSSLSIILACISGKIFFGEKINYMACLFAGLAIVIVNMDIDINKST